MSDRIALVTGATGGLGRHLVPKLVRAGYRVRASGRNLAVGKSLADSNVEFIGGDLRGSTQIRQLAKDADVIFHCAARSSPWGRYEEFHAINVEATRALADAAGAMGCNRFVLVSTPSIYFQFKDAFDVREDAALPDRFVNHYATTKMEAERIVQTAASERMKVTIIRPRGLFGELDSVLLPRLMKIARHGKMPIFNGGKALVDVTYAGNVADAMLLCDRADAPSGIYNITNGEPLPVRDLLQSVFRVLHLNVELVPLPYRLMDMVAGGWETVAKALAVETEPRLLRYSLGLMNYSQTLDITAARKRLGYVPTVRIEEGLERFANWFNAGQPESMSPRHATH
jgi:nucleoside-diphosphate-sugar epimerase